MRTVRFNPLMGLAYLGFISLGLPDGLLGVAWPWMRAEFGVPLGSVGFIITMSTIGYILSSVAAGFLLARLGVGVLLAGSTTLAGLGLTGTALSPVLAVAACSALVLGMGSGAIDSGLNAYAATNFGARHMNWLHAAFGLGAMLGPLVMTAAVTSSLTWRWGYGSVAAVLALLAISFAASARLWRSSASPDKPVESPAPVRHTLRVPEVWLGVAMFGFYTGLEIGAGLWLYTLLISARGMAPGPAGVCVSGFWGSLFAGRLLLGVLGDRVLPIRLVWTGLFGVGLGGLLLVPPWPATSVAGALLLGFAAAPVFPMLTLVTSHRVGTGHADRAVGLQMGAAGLGGIALPAGIGVLIGHYGAGILGPALATLAAITLGILAYDRFLLPSRNRLPDKALVD
ncbi:MAG TPA: MFS transporter [Candidatus Limnocylindrales bacterium]|nr:MFS transporter [Candidatus Limnocylindrales bacterium]